jgi:hypothetical protein
MHAVHFKQTVHASASYCRVSCSTTINPNCSGPPQQAHPPFHAQPARPAAIPPAVCTGPKWSPLLIGTPTHAAPPHYQSTNSVLHLNWIPPRPILSLPPAFPQPTAHLHKCPRLLPSPPKFPAHPYTPLCRHTRVLNSAPRSSALGNSTPVPRAHPPQPGNPARCPHACSHSSQHTAPPAAPMSGLTCTLPPVGEARHEGAVRHHTTHLSPQSVMCPHHLAVGHAASPRRHCPDHPSNALHTGIHSSCCPQPPSAAGLASPC